jgi:hypothetical protein
VDLRYLARPDRLIARCSASGSRPTTVVVASAVMIGPTRLPSNAHNAVRHVEHAALQPDLHGAAG